MPEYDGPITSRSAGSDCTDEEGDDPDGAFLLHEMTDEEFGVKEHARMGSWLRTSLSRLPGLSRLAPKSSHGFTAVPQDDHETKWAAIHHNTALSGAYRTGLLGTVCQITFRTWLNVLLVFVPLGIAAESAGLTPTVIFALNALAIIPLTGLLAFATENVAQSLGVAMGAMLNVTFGNMVEFLILIFMLREGHIRIVIASLIGSVLVNLLFILGLAIIIGGLRHREQAYNRKIASMLAYLMSAGVMALLIPTSLYACIKKRTVADSVTLKFSRGIALALLVLYVVYLYFQLGSHAHLYETPKPADEEAIPMAEASTPTLPVQPASTKLPPPLPVPLPPLDTPHDSGSEISTRSALALLVVSSGLVSVCAEFLVDSIEHVVAHSHLTEAFLGLILLPLLGNTAELGTAVTMAVKNKIDLAINLTLGSAIQITFFMAPTVITIGWATGREVGLGFDMFQTIALVVTMLLVNFMMAGGRVNYLLGALLLMSYVIIGIGAYFLPDQKRNKSS
ncbi:calcium/proton exchanger [Trichodelitschia bisporula]|uniref:Vacuolar calcium ion transporter n=1 Tax=Trichodelitschia bisporula TaxID=703511 RepID=A0A6G1HR39_9PEZI|nr:calcium/proton exchanger [Trichodelitschia bisporula]